MINKYKNFRELAEHETESVDFDIEVKDMGSRYVVIAIHGGNIEPCTTEIAKAISGEEISFYSLIGKKKTKNTDLHITSSNFDEPRCVDLVGRSSVSISVHGKSEQDKFIMVGGLDDDLVKKIVNALESNSFEIREPPQILNGRSPENICNRCSSKKGVQLEISRGLRDVFIEDRSELSRFCSVIRSVL